MSTEHSLYARWAREVLKAYFEKRHPQLDSEEGFLHKAACFVTLHNKSDNSLRGCIGTLSPNQSDLKEEIHTNALSAALNDPRFSPLRADELNKISISVDVLDTPEAVSSLEELDPKVYGVIVSSGHKRGVLLPDLPGIDRIEDQMAIAMRKAGIEPGTPIHVERFKVTRYH